MAPSMRTLVRSRAWPASGSCNRHHAKEAPSHSDCVECEGVSSKQRRAKMAPSGKDKISLPKLMTNLSDGRVADYECHSLLGRLSQRCLCSVASSVISSLPVAIIAWHREQDESSFPFVCCDHVCLKRGTSEFTSTARA